MALVKKPNTPSHVTFTSEGKNSVVVAREAEAQCKQSRTLAK